MTENSNNENNTSAASGSRRGRAWLTVAAAVAIVAALGLVPWEKLTDGAVKDYSLVGDLKDNADDAVSSPDAITDASVGENAGTSGHGSGLAGGTDAQAPDGEPAAGGERLPAATEVINNRSGDKIIIEDYSVGQKGLRNLKNKLASGGLGRIAVVGDSYIEGDIMTQDLRAKLQTRYGGNGVGYMNLHSDFPGFRRSVTQGGKGWKSYTATKRGKGEYMGLSEQYSQSQGSATATYKGVTKVANAKSWTQSLALFIAPSGGTVSTRTSDDAEWTTHTLDASPEVQPVEVSGPTSDFQLRVNDPSIIALGVWLNDDRGIALDCMSSRGVPGYSLAKISPELSHQMGKYVDYDLIVLEFGINAMSGKQRDYSAFTKNMVKVVDNLRLCYPNAQILMLGVGDRGEKRSGTYHSMSTIESMIAAQRKAAMESGVMFWDTRAAMGGEDAIVEWAHQGKANKDYIHLTHKGGEALATSLSEAIIREIDK